MSHSQYIKKFESERDEIEKKITNVEFRMKRTLDNESWMALRQAYNVLLTKRHECRQKINNARAGKNPWGAEISSVTIPKNR